MSAMAGIATAAFVASNAISFSETALNAYNIYDGNSSSVSYEGGVLRSAIIGFSAMDGFVLGVSSHATDSQDCLEFTARGMMPEVIEGIHSIIGVPGAALAGTLVGTQQGLAQAFSVEKPAGFCGGPA